MRAGRCWRREETYSRSDFAVQRAKEESAVLPPLPPPLPLSLSSSVRACVVVCVRLSRLCCCSPPPQKSWDEEGKRLYLARGKREELGSPCKTNQRL
ncbi:hypothetical protein PBY51_007636 [Eleginops maclovinus]|uniref:Uncharacterized protein n=1 Tax=Eleginops maclovinus TaxID=56733 RepID=A0AAN7X9F0_ELEMC|nr:hypothetical protein PBY51_007636 [Eleginops maclovinus]